MTTTARDYYDILGLKKDAPQEDIKRAFRRLARKHHPDLNPGDKAAEKKFKEINEAYEILSNPKKRAEYDEFGTTAFAEGAGFGGFRSYGFDFKGAEDIFSDLFGTFRHEETPLRGHDIEAKLDISLDEAYRGVKKPITLTREVPCKSCGGSGAESSQACSSCNGTGSMQQKRGFFRLSQPCPVCKGRGSVTSKTCGSCRMAVPLSQKRSR
jgi:molecular chaperone DnaJ